MTIQEKYGFRKVLNARGPATILGAARVSDPIRKEIYDILGESVEIWELQRSASQRIARLTGAQAGCVVNCSSAGMAIAAAAVLTGSDPAKIKALPDVTWPRKKILIQKGQVTGAGDCPVWQVIKMTGAEYVEIGEALDCATFHLRAALDDTTAAAFYVMEDTFAPNLLPLETFVAICHEKGVPVICDAAYLTDFTMLAQIGVDLAIYSGQKWLGGCTSGIIAGRKDLVHACFMQEMGIGRPMKVGKEGIVSIMASIDSWLSRDSAAIEKRQQRLADTIAKALQGMAGVTCAVVKSLYSPSVRLHVDIDAEQAGVSAWEINEDMGRLDPVIKTDDYFVSGGKLIFDMAYLDSEDAALIADVLRSYLTGERRAAQRENVPKPRQDILYEMFNAWLDGDPRG
ncbi:MAG TPA: aminotransferase class V-fold PLP-dependent enzyme [Candidatus Ruthenibacterium merdigallinarum]|nr:aminotransferase class V-fold PLP-dependent enzyme [Candidatus Ruthenibacterium merdigallinarum]